MQRVLLVFMVLFSFFKCESALQSSRIHKFSSKTLVFSVYQKRWLVKRFTAAQFCTSQMSLNPSRSYLLKCAKERNMPGTGESAERQQECSARAPSAWVASLLSSTHPEYASLAHPILHQVGKHPLCLTSPGLFRPGNPSLSDHWAQKGFPSCKLAWIMTPSSYFICSWPGTAARVLATCCRTGSLLPE